MPRSYDASGRARAAQATRRRIVECARDLLLGGGYANMKIADLADTANVSPQTVYNAIGGKAEVVKAVYDLMLAGDDDSTPMSERAAFLRITQAADVESFAVAYAAWTQGIYERTGPLLSVLLAHGPGADPLLKQFVHTMDSERRMGNTHAVTGLAQQLALPTGSRRERLVDEIWTLTSPAVYDHFVHRCGWSAASYRHWLARHLRLALRPPRRT